MAQFFEILSIFSRFWQFRNLCNFENLAISRIWQSREFGNNSQKLATQIQHFLRTGMETPMRSIYQEAINRAEKTTQLSSTLMLKWCAPSYSLPVIAYSMFQYYVRGAGQSSFEVIFYMA